jgi:phage-related protein
MYTNNPNTGNLATIESSNVNIRWMGDTHEEIKGFPAGVRHNLGTDLRRLQDGLKPLDGGPMPGIGPGVYELRDEDIGSWYRLIYLKQTKGMIYILHCFFKKSNQTSKQDIKTARIRLSQVNKELLEDEKNAKRGARHGG